MVCSGILGIHVNGVTAWMFPLIPYWLKTPLFNLWASCKVVYSESFNCYFLGFWASKILTVLNRNCSTCYDPYEGLFVFVNRGNILYTPWKEKGVLGNMAYLGIFLQSRNLQSLFRQTVLDQMSSLGMFPLRLTGLNRDSNRGYYNPYGPMKEC